MKFYGNETASSIKDCGGLFYGFHPLVALKLINPDRIMYLFKFTHIFNLKPVLMLNSHLKCEF